MRTTNLAIVVAILSISLAQTPSVGEVSVETPGNHLANRPKPVGGFSSSRIDSQALAWTRKSESINSTEWTMFPPPGYLPIRSRGPVTAVVSVVLEGGPVEIRMRAAGHTLRPGPVSFEGSGPGDLVGTPHTFSFSDQRRLGPDCHRYLPEWRSPSGARIGMNSFNIVLVYRAARVNEFCE